MFSILSSKHLTSVVDVSIRWTKEYYIFYRNPYGNTQIKPHTIENTVVDYNYWNVSS